MRALATLSAAALLGAAGFAATLGGSADADTPARYDLKPVDGGFLRLDRDSGATAFCKVTGDTYARAPTKEDRAGSESEIRRLEARVAALEEQVKTLGSGLPPVPALPKDPPALKDQSLNLPSEKQMDELATFFERALRRMKRLATELEKDAPADGQSL